MGIQNPYQDVVDWLNGPDGRRWSRSVHRGISYGCKWFSFKPDVEGGVGYDVGWSVDVETQWMGAYDEDGIEFFRPEDRGKPLAPSPHPLVGLSSHGLMRWYPHIYDYARA